MKKTNAFIAAALITSMLTSCGGTDTAEITSSESTTVATVSETDTLSAESEETTTETSVETTASVSDTEAVEEAENTHWDTIVYDTTLKVDATEWGSDENAVNSVNPNTFCTIAEAIERANVPDEITAYWYENSSMYKWHFDNDTKIRGVVSGIKDFDSDGVDETLYALNYISYYDEAFVLTSSEIAVYDKEDGVIHGVSHGVMNVGCYFASDPAVECKSPDTSRYGEYLTCEGTNMYFTEDNIFISCVFGLNDWGYASAYNYYDRLIYENGEYRVESVGNAGWRFNILPSDVEYTETHELYRTASVDGDVPCIIK